MTPATIKFSFLTYFRNLGLYDYIAFGWLLITFLILIFLAILVARKSSIFSLLLIIMSLIIFVVSPFFIKTKLAELLRPVDIHLESIKKLTFSDTLIVNVILTNQASKDFKKCLIATTIIQDIPTSGYQYYLHQLKPIDYQSILVDEPLAKEESMEYKVVFDNYTYEGNITALIRTECY